MPKLKNRMPKLCRDGKKAISWYKGKRIYHGSWGSQEAEKNYKRFIAALLENSVLPLRIGGNADVLVSELAAAFLDGIETRMDKTTIGTVKQAIGYLVEFYGELAVDEFSPKKLKVIRSQMVKAGRLCRSQINRYVGYVKRLFAWGVEEEVVQSSVIHALREVKDLRRGENGTFDHPPREEVPDDVVAKTLPFLAPTVAAMVQVQRLTGCRPSEIFNMRVGDIDRSRDNGLWYYSPKHKTEEHIGKKPIPLGKPEQDLIAPYLVGKKPGSAVFSPKTAMKERATQARANRKSKLTPSQRERDAKRAEKNESRVGEFYDASSYRKAVEYAIAKGNRQGVKIPHWTQSKSLNAEDIMKGEQMGKKTIVKFNENTGLFETIKTSVSQSELIISELKETLKQCKREFEAIRVKVREENSAKQRIIPETEDILPQVEANRQELQKKRTAKKTQTTLVVEDAGEPLPQVETNRQDQQEASKAGIKEPGTLPPPLPGMEVFLQDALQHAETSKQKSEGRIEFEVRNKTESVIKLRSKSSTERETPYQEVLRLIENVLINGAGIENGTTKLLGNIEMFEQQHPTQYSNEIQQLKNNTQAIKHKSNAEERLLENNKQILAAIKENTKAVKDVKETVKEIVAKRQNENKEPKPVYTVDKPKPFVQADLPDETKGFWMSQNEFAARQGKSVRTILSWRTEKSGAVSLSKDGKYIRDKYGNILRKVNGMLNSPCEYFVYHDF